MAAAAVGPLAAGLGLFFTGCFFRAVYATTRRTVLTTAGAIALLGLTARSADIHEWRRTFVSQAFGIAAATLLTRKLVATLTRQTREVVRNERLLLAVFDSLDVSVMVGASTHARAMMNRAARRLHQELGLPEAPAPWQSALAVYGTDGRTPLTPEQMPAALALRGEHVRDMDVVLGSDNSSSRESRVLRLGLGTRLLRRRHGGDPLGH